MSASRQLTPLFEGGTYFECPRWHAGRWWASDFYRHIVVRYDAEGREETILEVPHQPSGLGWMPNGDLLVVSMKDRRILRRDEDGGVTVHADITDLVTGHPNDMVVDRAGRAFVGNFGFDLMGGTEDPRPTVLVRVDPGGAATVVADNLWFPNGMVIADNGTFVVAETFGGRLTAFTLRDDGTLADRRVWAQLGPTPDPSSIETMIAGATFAPDGIALDAEGHIWVANALGVAVSRVAPGGAIVEEIPMPDGLGVFACGLGGPDGRTLLMCAAPDFHEEARTAAREGVLLRATVDVPGAGLP